MSDAQSFECPSCGAPLQVKGAELQIKCDFCGNVVTVPENLRQKPPAQTNRQNPQVIVVQLPGVVGGNAADEAFLAGQAAQSSARRRARGGCVGAFARLVLFFVVMGTVIAISFFSNSAARRGLTGALNSLFTTSTPFRFGTGLPSVSASDLIATALGATRTSTPGSRGIATNTPAAMFNDATAVPSSVSNIESGRLTFGGEGTGPGLFKDARYIDVDGSGNVYVGEYDPPRIQRFDSTGKYLNGWIIDGKKPLIVSMSVARDGTVYVVTNTSMSTLLRFEGATGKQLSSITAGGDMFGDFTTLPDGKIVAIVTHNNTSDDLVRLSPDGKLLSRIPKFWSTQTDNPPMDTHIATDGLGTTYVVGGFEYAVLKYSSSGKYINRFGQRGDDAGQFRAFQTGIAVDNKSRVYVTDFKGILVFDPDGRYLKLITTPLTVPRSLAMTDKNELYALAQNKVIKFTGLDSN